MNIEIKDRFNATVLFSLETENIKLCLQAAVKSGAYLRGAYLLGADLRGADLRGAKVDGLLLIGDRPVLQIGPIGSGADYLISFLTENGIRIRAGCFSGTLDEFEKDVSKTHGKEKHAIEYFSAIQLIYTHAAIWTPAPEEKAAA